MLEWFAARREMDGLPDNPRKAKELAAAAAAARGSKAPQQQLQGIVDGGNSLQPLLPAELLTPRAAAAQAVTQQQQQLDEASSLPQQTQQQQQQQQGRVRVQSLTAREMAALRSSLPSPRKQKGEKLKQELGIKAGVCVGFVFCRV